IFYSDPEQVLVVTDTLSVSPDGSPLLFSSKAHYLPHLRTIVAGTGVAGFSGEWAMRANNRMVIRGIENLDHHTPAALQSFWHPSLAISSDARRYDNHRVPVRLV